MKKIIPIILTITISTTVFASTRAKHIGVFNRTLPKPMFTVSPSSYWIGASLAYNFDEGGSTENIIGAGRAQIGFVKQFKDNKYFKLPITGNVAQVVSNVSSESFTKDLNKIVQSNQGLCVGLSPVYTINPDNENSNLFRAYASVNYKVNGFKTKDSLNTLVNLNQFRGTMGFEFEGWQIDNGGPMNFSIEGIYSSFDQTLYNKVFNRDINHIISLEMQVIIPVGGPLAISIMGDYSKGARPLYQAGFIMKSNQ